MGKIVIFISFPPAPPADLEKTLSGQETDGTQEVAKVWTRCVAIEVVAGAISAPGPQGRVSGGREAG